MRSVPRCIPLSPAQILEEHKHIFDDLLKTNVAYGLNCTLRVAGGWVRDTLLKELSHDIDIAIESPPTGIVSGEAFARAVSDYVASATSSNARTVSVIRTNPEMSKHIETATVVVRGLQVEFCMLRADTYAEGNTRIPQIRPGTPTEDAYRRDFTINALFYNLHTGLVEDFISVPSGDIEGVSAETTALDDLVRFKTIRCPLEPRQTFEDDPLRLLRGVRFVGQLGKFDFALHPSIPSCVDANLRELLLRKVSRERIGKEFTKMLSGDRPDKCVQILDGMRLLQEVLLVEVGPAGPSGDGKPMDMRSWEDAGTECWELLRFLNTWVTSRFSSFPAAFQNTPDARLVACLFVLVIPFLQGQTSKDVEARLQSVCMNSLKLPAAVFQATRKMVDCFNELRSQSFTTDELLGDGVDDGTKHKLFVALGHLNDKHMPVCAFQVVMHTYTAAEGAADAATTRPDRVWSQMLQCPEVLNAYSTVLPLKGNELKKIIPAMRPAEIGPTLLFLREQMMLNPSLNRAGAEALLAEWHASQQEL